jgi:hypothetical protein
MAQPTQFSVVLITSAQSGMRDSGSGFVVGAGADGAYVATCAHVVRGWDPEWLRVNGLTATVASDGGESGLDVAVLHVPSLRDVHPLPMKEFVRPGASVYGYCFKHLYGDDYVRSRAEGKIGRLLSLQGKSAQRSVAAWEVVAGSGSVFEAGNSGSPLIEAKTQRVVGMLSHAQRDGRTGIAISPEAIRRAWAPLKAKGVFEPDWFESASDVLERSAPRAGGRGGKTTELPPRPSPIVHEDDPQKGRFGGKSERSGRRLTAEPTDTSDPNHFYVDFVVHSLDASPLVPPVRFFLHDSYPKNVIVRQRTEKGGTSIALRDVYAYGVYTVGCQVRDRAGKWVELEYDLAKVKGLPRRFLER